jgi:hypothetical protein
MLCPYRAVEYVVMFVHEVELNAPVFPLIVARWVVAMLLAAVVQDAKALVQPPDM